MRSIADLRDSVDMTVQEAIRFTGRSRKCVYELVRDRRVMAYRDQGTTGRIRIDTQSLLAYLARRGR